MNKFDALKKISLFAMALLMCVIIVACDEGEDNGGSDTDAVTSRYETTTTAQTTAQTTGATTGVSTGETTAVTTSATTSETIAETTAETTATTAETTVATTTGTTAPDDNETPDGDENQGGEDESEKNYDVPADADGYEYSSLISDRIRQYVSYGDFDDAFKRFPVYDKTPIVTFVEVGERTSTQRQLVVYAKFKCYSDSEHYCYTKSIFSVNVTYYNKLKNPSNFSTYSEFAELFATAISDGTLTSVDYSSANDFAYMTEEQSTKLAAIIDEKFVDVDINFAGLAVENLEFFYIINGFAYDKDGNSYSFSTQIQNGELWKDFINGVEDGTINKDTIPSIETESKRIDSVFVAEAE